MPVFFFLTGNPELKKPDKLQKRTCVREGVGNLLLCRRQVLTQFSWPFPADRHRERTANDIQNKGRTGSVAAPSLLAMTEPQAAQRPVRVCFVVGGVFLLARLCICVTCSASSYACMHLRMADPLAEGFTRDNHAPRKGNRIMRGGRDN